MAPRATIERARSLRRRMSPPEVRLWVLLRARPGGFHFRRQHPIGPYVLDFYCPASRLAIEIDGIAHGMGDRPERDAIRTRRLEEVGIATLRIAAIDVMDKVGDAVAAIVERCASPLHHPADGPPPHAWHGED